MVKFPITEDMIFNYDRTISLNRELVRAFVLTVNRFYEEAKDGANTIPYVTGSILNSVYEQRFNEKPDEALSKWFEVSAEYINEALRQGERDNNKGDERS